MLDLVRLSPRLIFPPGGVDLYRQIALLTDMSEGDEVLDVACGRGVALEYFVRKYGVHGSGVDADPRLVEAAEARSRQEGLATQVQFQSAPSDRLPYRDEIFDVAVAEIGVARNCDPADAVRELVRVTKPGGMVVLVPLVWKGAVDGDRQRVLSEHLGARPLMRVEWKRLLKDAGVVDVHAEDWSDDDAAFRSRGVTPFPDFAEIFSLPEKVGIVRRAWSRWGWRGVRTVLSREREVHHLLTRERILGLDLVKGRKRDDRDQAPDQARGDTEAGSAAPPAETGEGPGRRRGQARREEGREGGDDETAGLPLFGAEGKRE